MLRIFKLLKVYVHTMSDWSVRAATLLTLSGISSIRTKGMSKDKNNQH